MKKTKRFIVKGIVQGVGYRYFVLKNASSIGVAGFVRNLFDGSVEILASVNTDQLDKLRTKLEQGPSYSKVDTVYEEDIDYNPEMKSFYIKD